MNKLNKLVNNMLPENAITIWNSPECQKRVKRILKSLQEKKCKKEQTSYIKFCIDQRPKMKEEFPGLATKDITGKLGEKWNRLKIEDPEYLIREYGYNPDAKQKIKVVNEIDVKDETDEEDLNDELRQ